MSLDKAVKKLKFDSRLTEIALANGQLTKEEHEAYLKSLPDSAPQSVAVDLENEEDNSETLN